MFSNTLAQMIAATSVKVLDMLESGDGLREKLRSNSTYFSKQMSELGFELVAGEHPIISIIPVMLGDAKLAKTFANEMLVEGI